MLDCLKPKSKEEIKESFKSCKTFKQFFYLLDKYKEKYNEDIPTDYYPLTLQLFQEAGGNLDDVKNSFNNQFHFKIKNTSISVHQMEKHARIVMFPVRKIKNLEHIRSGNIFDVQTNEQFWEIINFIKTH